jgi:hypothetical protein
VTVWWIATKTVTVRYVSIFILDYFDAIHQTVTVRYASIFILDYFDAIHQTVTVRYVSILVSGTPVSSTNKTDRQDIIEILLKVALNTINQTIFVTDYKWNITVSCKSNYHMKKLSLKG